VVLAIGIVLNITKLSTLISLSTHGYGLFLERESEFIQRITDDGLV